jgi:ATP-dependent DNA ligase
MGRVVDCPCPLAPMAPALVRPPFHRDGWVYEEKVDGLRILAARFHELAAAIAKLRADVLVLDGEVAVFDKELVSRFHLLGDNDDFGILCTSPIFIGFDALQVGRRDLRAGPPAERRVSSKTSSTGTRWCYRVVACPTTARRPGRSSRNVGTKA